MKKKQIGGFLFLILLPFVAFSQTGPPWVKTYVGYNYIFRGIDFPSNQSDIGYMAGESLTYNGNGIVIKTTDGGATWNPVWTGANQGVEGSCFVDVNTGFIAGWPKFSAGWSGFGKTTDGGQTWTSPSVVADLYYFTDVVFKDADNGILVGATNTNAGVWVTGNGGQTWTNGTGLQGVPYHACHVSGNTWFLCDNAGHIQKSVNGGVTWTTVYTVPGLMLLGIRFLDDNTGLVTGDDGKIFKTYDGGATWSAQTIGTDLWHDTGWETADHLYICGTPEIVAESWDGGSSWGNGFPNSTMQAALYECIFTENGKGFICGSQGTLLKRDPSCIAAFTVSSTTACTGNPVIFTSQSYGSNLSYNWWFEGGTPSTSTTPNPAVTYNATGVFDVRLIVSNSTWTDTLLKTDYITVSQPPAAPVITANGFVLTSSAPAGNQWYRDGTPIIGATGQTHTATQTGWYWDVVTVNGCSSDTSNHIYLVMTGTGESADNKITLSPVPSDGLFTITWKQDAMPACRINIYNPSGLRVYHEDVTPREDRTCKTIDLRTFAAGAYFLEMVTAESRTVKKLVILR